MAPKLVPKLEKLVEDLGIPAIAAIALLPVIVPLAAGLGKPIAKIMVKSGIVLYQKSKKFLAEARENLDDILDEVKAELTAENVKKLEEIAIHSEMNY